VVFTVSVTVTGFVPSSVTEEGDTEHVAPAGAPAQLKVTVWLNAPTGPTETV
jgi:hypothetical protein